MNGDDVGHSQAGHSVLFLDSHCMFFPPAMCMAVFTMVTVPCTLILPDVIERSPANLAWILIAQASQFVAAAERGSSDRYPGMTGRWKGMSGAKTEGCPSVCTNKTPCINYASVLLFRSTVFIEGLLNAEPGAWP